MCYTAHDCEENVYVVVNKLLKTKDILTMTYRQDMFPGLSPFLFVVQSLMNILSETKTCIYKISEFFLANPFNDNIEDNHQQHCTP